MVWLIRETIHSEACSKLAYYPNATFTNLDEVQVEGWQARSRQRMMLVKHVGDLAERACKVDW